MIRSVEAPASSLVILRRTTFLLAQYKTLLTILWRRFEWKFIFLMA